jgi:predicted dehydrogenase
VDGPEGCAVEDAVNERLRVLHVGCGGISRLWLDALRDAPDAEFVGFVDLDPERAHEAARHLGSPAPVGSDLRAMLARTRPDVVFDCTVPEAHHGVAIAALEAGCHVFCEKPLADALAPAHAMIDAAAASGRALAVMQNRRYDPNARALRDFLAEGHVGRVTTLHADFFIAPHFGGFRESMEHVLLRDMAIHTFDSARFLAGEEPLTAFGTSWNPAGSWYAHGASAAVTFEMTGGVVFTYRGSWCAEGLPTPWESQWRIVGTQGSVVWDGAESLRCEIVRSDDGFLREHASVPTPTLQRTEFGHWHAASIRAYLDAVRAGRTPETVATDNIRSLAMVFAAIESAETHRRVSIASLTGAA